MSVDTLWYAGSVLHVWLYVLTTLVVVVTVSECVIVCDPEGHYSILEHRLGGFM